MTQEKKATVLASVLEGLMRRYKDRVSDVALILNAMVEQGLVASQDDVINDHIAFRTMGVPQLGVQSLEKIFLAYGYEKRDYFFFEGKKLDAWWFSPPKESENLPRVFISECRVHELSEEAQEIIHKYTSEVKEDPVLSLDLMDAGAVDRFLHQALWTTPTWEDYSRVLQESEYAAWVLYNRYYLNHFTITIQALKEGYNTIEAFNDFLESLGVVLNTAGGKIKRSQDGLLLQSSTVSKTIPALFRHEDGAEKRHYIAGSYVEFAQRIDGREGFEASNADKIFESTYTEQIERD